MAQLGPILAGASSLASFGIKEAQSKFELGQAEIAAKEEELRLVQREADRKDRLASAMSAQNAMAGASGVAAFEGSPLAVLQDSIKREEEGSQRDEFSTKMTSLAIRSSAKNKRRFDKLNNRLGLIQSGSSIMQAGAVPSGGSGA